MTANIRNLLDKKFENENCEFETFDGEHDELCIGGRKDWNQEYWLPVPHTIRTGEDVQAWLDRTVWPHYIHQLVNVELEQLRDSVEKTIISEVSRLELAEVAFPEDELQLDKNDAAYAINDINIGWQLNLYFDTGDDDCSNGVNSYHEIENGQLEDEAIEMADEYADTLDDEDED